MDEAGELLMNNHATNKIDSITCSSVEVREYGFGAKLLIIVLLIIIALTSTASAEIQTLGTFKKGTCVELLQTCSNCTYVNISSVIYPNSTQALGLVAMTKTGTKYNYTFCNANYSGIYIVNGYGDVDGVTTVYAYDFEVNPQGIPSTEQRSRALSTSVYFMFGIAILLFIGFMFLNTSPPVKWTFFIVSVVFFIIGLNLITINVTDEVVNPRLESFLDTFLGICIYFYWFAAGLLILLWLFTFLNTWLYQKNMSALSRFGGGEY